MGNCCATPSVAGDEAKKKNRKNKENPFAIDYGFSNSNTTASKLTVLKSPAGKEIEARYELGRELGCWHCQACN
jgi:calcium-dependent protein kinase